MTETLDVNRHLAVVGCVGKHQWITFFLIGTPFVQFGWQMFMIIFTHNTPAFRCIDTRNNSTDLDQANITFDSKCELTSIIDNVTITIKCTEFSYDNDRYGETAIERFDLVCGRSYISTLTEMISMAVTAVGVVGGSYAGDRIGRKPVIIIGCFGGCVFGMIQAFSVNVIMYSATKIIVTVFSSATFTPVFSLMLESVATEHRPHVANALEFFWIAGTMSLSLISYLLRDWWKIQLLASGPIILVPLISIWVLDESPHWLATNGKPKKALAVLQKMATWNKVQTTGLSFDAADYHVKHVNAKNLVKEENFLRFWKHKRLAARFFVFSYAWIVCTLCYYSLSFGIRNLPGNLYINNVISSLAEALAYGACFCIAWWGRKWPSVVSMFGGSLTLLISVFIMTFSPESETAVTVMSMMGKMCITAAWQIVIVWSGELYPTTHRCTLVSMNVTVGRIGGVIAPLLLDLHKFIDVANEKLIMPILFVVLLIAGGFLHMIPPETNKCRLPEVIKEANERSFPLDDQVDRKRSDKDSEQEAAEKFDLLEQEECEKVV